MWLYTAPRDGQRLFGGSQQFQESRTRGLERDASRVTRQGGEAVLFEMPADFRVGNAEHERKDVMHTRAEIVGTIDQLVHSWAGVLRTIGGQRGALIALSQVRGVGRRGWSVGRVLFPGALRRSVRRPSISDHRCRWPRAVHPRTRAGSPRACAVRPCSGRGLPSRPGHPGRWWSLAPPFHPYLKHCFRRSVLCGTVPRVAPGGCCPPPCPSEPGPSSTYVVTTCAAAARPTPPRCSV